MCTPFGAIGGPSMTSEFALIGIEGLRRRPAHSQGAAAHEVRIALIGIEGLRLLEVAPARYVGADVGLNCPDLVLRD